MLSLLQHFSNIHRIFQTFFSTELILNYYKQGYLEDKKCRGHHQYLMVFNSTTPCFKKQKYERIMLHNFTTNNGITADC